MENISPLEKSLRPSLVKTKWPRFYHHILVLWILEYHKSGISQ